MGVPKRADASKLNLEFKVTPYRLVNMTTKRIVITRRRLQKSGPAESKTQQPRQPNSGRRSKDSTIPREYTLEPGASADYEVDYEEEAQQLIMTARDELVRKQDFIDIDIAHSGQRSRVSAHNLGNLRAQSHVLSEAPFDCIEFGVTLSESRISKTFILRQPFIL
jgi:hypothetical protein